ncbi:hypothetical protein [Paenibacillus sp. sgz500958]|uniref:hypothetical protein n=1 Tax=Paenibacillus sp. sgz500958 TaxID=3242475 RepID=UPI0036D3E83A
MKFRMKSVGAITKTNFTETTWIAYLVALLSFASVFIQILIRYLLNSKNTEVSEGNLLILALIIAAVLIPSVNFRKFMHLNAKKADFFWASIINYIILSVVLSIINLVLYATVDSVMGSVVTIWNIIDLFGWMEHGIIVAFFMQFAFYLLVGVTIHTLTLMQTFWFGWLIDLIIATIISVFIPIPSLRTVLTDFLNLIIFNSNALAQVSICVALSAVIYALNIPILSLKKI